MEEYKKNHRRAALRAFKDKERVEFTTSLPAPKSDIKALFDYLDATSESCDETLRQTIKFIKERGLSEEKIISWLNEHGGFCDCEVIANVEDMWNQMIREE